MMLELIKSYYKESYNFMVLCLTFIVVFPSYIENFGYKSAFLTLPITYGVSKIHWLRKEEVGSQIWGISSWLKLLGLIARLGIACSSFGHLLTSYQGSENVAYHLFPQIPWVMPVTVPIALSVFIALGLQPSLIIKIIFDIFFGVLLMTFLTIGVYVIYSDSNILQLELTGFYEVPAGMLFFLSLFTIETSGKEITKRQQNSIQFWSCLVVMMALAFLNEKLKCNGLGDCLKHFHEWYEPLYLALSVSCLGLCLVDLFTAASELLQQITEFEELHSTIFRKLTLNSTVYIGLLCVSLVYFYTPTMLIILSNSSILILLALENFNTLCLAINYSSLHKEQKNSIENNYSELNQNDPVELNTSDEDSCSDIDAIVEEYRAQVQVLSGQNLATDIYLKRASYIFKLILTTIAVCSILMSLAFQSKVYKFWLSMSTAILILVILLQWATNTINSMLLKPKMSVYYPVMMYIFHIFLIGFIPSSVWVYIILWTLKGAAIKISLITVKKLNSRREFKHFFSIRESPPVFGTSCVKKSEEKKSKIVIHA